MSKTLGPSWRTVIATILAYFRHNVRGHGYDKRTNYSADEKNNALGLSNRSPVNNIWTSYRINHGLPSRKSPNNSHGSKNFFLDRNLFWLYYHCLWLYFWRPSPQWFSNRFWLFIYRLDYRGNNLRFLAK